MYEDTLNYLLDNMQGGGSGELDELKERIEALEGIVATKQDELTFDATPTANSNNPVKSSGILTAINNSKSVATKTITNITAVSVASGTNTNLFSFTLTAGTYLITFGSQFPNNSNGNRSCWLSNASKGATLGRGYEMAVGASNGSRTTLNASVLVTLTASTTFYCVVYQNSGSALNASGFYSVLKV